MKKRYLNRWFVLGEFNGFIKRAKCIDIEFQTNFGPVFLMESTWGHKFWLTRKELAEFETTN